MMSTPRPWRRNGRIIVDANYRMITDLRGYDAEVAETGDLIVRAVNAHDDLLAALKNAAHALGVGAGDHEGEEGKYYAEAETAARAAIARAEGRKP